ncbi:hypothetical protein [Bradyrhizobium sp. CCBAU 51753]|uniref:SGNH/GDSL hydrolase family protein n=1 Tax=Bradyrhizobium sp. CCBAU 51753 TaxID=1325100 RepID=UPI00188C4A0D|nr:hypothetical protein [Bradyrhizobium sp. CCBAU 51753]
MSSFTFSSKHWLYLFLSIVVTVVVTFGVASERLLRIYITPIDNYEWIASLLVSSSQPNAAFGDSHIAAVPDYNKPDFINLGIGGTTIRKMNDRVRYYYRNLQPGQVIIQADPHSFAEYRLEAQGSYVPEVYSAYRLRILDPRHRGFMLEYWKRFLLTGNLRGQQQPGYDQLWESVGNILIGQPKPQEASTEHTSAPAETIVEQKTNSAPQPASGSPSHTASNTAKVEAESAAASPAPVTAANAAPAPAASPAPAAAANNAPVAAANAAPAAAANAAPAATANPAPVTTTNPAPAATANPAPVITTNAASAPTANAAPTAETNPEMLAKFNAFMDYEVNTHTPVANFRERDEARIYRDLIAFLVARGAKVCLVNYPVDTFYRERADRIPAFAETRKFYQEVARANGIPYVSFWDRFDDPAMYQNTDHVNEKGSPILAREAREKCFGKAGPG